MSDWVSDYFIAYNLFPKRSTFTNKPDPRLEVGTEDALRYLRERSICDRRNKTTLLYRPTP